MMSMIDAATGGGRVSDWVPGRRFDSEQGQIAWEVFGDGDVPVVLTHGTPFSSVIWADVVAAMASDWRLYVWDLAGYGASERYDGQQVSLDVQTRILGALLDHWGLDDPVLVGHDFGGAITLRTVVLDRTPAARLVLVDPVSVAPWGTGFFRLASRHADVLEQLPEPVHDGLVRGYVGWASSQTLDEQVLDALVTPWRGPDGRAALYRQIVQNDQRFTDEVQPRYGEIEVPTLIVWGADDAWLPVAQAHELHGLIPGSRLEVIAGAGHLVPMDAPAALTSAIERFLTESDA